MRQTKTTYECDDCSASETVDGTDLPDSWTEVRFRTRNSFGEVMDAFTGGFTRKKTRYKEAVCHYCSNCVNSSTEIELNWAKWQEPETKDSD